MPPAANASSSRITETVGPARVQPRRNSPAVPAPARAKVLRTRVGDPPVGDPTENYRGSRVAQVSQPANFRHRTHRKVALTHQIKWQPGDLEVQHVVCAEQAPAGSHIDRCIRSSRNPAPLCSTRETTVRPSGIHANQGTSQAMLTTPRTMKKERHPNRAKSVPPKNVPKAGPHPTPAAMGAFANPRPTSGTCRTSILA